MVIIRLVHGRRAIDVTYDTPMVVMLRDLMYEGDWELIELDLKSKGSLIDEIEKCKYIEENITPLGEEIYEPVSYPEFRWWLEKMEITPDDFQHVSLNGLYDLALEYADKGLYETAYEVINHMLEIDPNYAPAYELMGSLHLEQGRIEEGLRYLDKAVEIDPWMVEAYSSLGEAYYNLGDYERAVYYWEKEIEKAPENKLTYFMIANAYEKLEDYESAISTLEKLLERDPDNILAMYEIAQFYRKMGKDDVAEEIEERISSMTPKRSSDLEVWAKVMLKRGKYEEVVKVLEDFLKKVALNTHIKMLLVIPYVKLGQIEKAKEIVDALKMNNMWYYYGKRELYSEFLDEEEMKLCGIS